MGEISKSETRVQNGKGKRNSRIPVSLPFGQVGARSTQAIQEQACTDPKRLCDWLVGENNRIFFHEMMWYMCR